MNSIAIIAAAGKGERMKSPVHKVLQKICGKAIIDYMLDNLDGIIDGKPIVVVSHEKQQVIDHLGERAVIVDQNAAVGWGTAIPVRASKSLLEGHGGITFVCLGDLPCVSRESLSALKKLVEDGADAALLTVEFPNPFKYGRVVRDKSGNVQAIVEEKDCTDEQRLIKEINAGIICYKTESLLGVIDEVQCNNAKGEFYLSDTIELLSKKGGVVKAHITGDIDEGQGANDPADLAASAAIVRKKINHAHMLNGVHMIDPSATYIDCGVEIGAGTVIYPGCVLEGKTVIGANVKLMPNCRIADSVIADNVTIESSLITSASVGAFTTVGPNAYLRPDSKIGEHCRIGDFVEIKNAKIGDGTKISHLTYVGDAVLGKNINLGCGVIFSNYDGKKKHVSTVGDNAFIGGNCSLISPVNVGKDAYIAAGSTVTSDVPDGALYVARTKDAYIKEGWVAARRAKGLL